MNYTQNIDSELVNKLTPEDKERFLKFKDLIEKYDDLYIQLNELAEEMYEYNDVVSDWFDLNINCRLICDAAEDLYGESNEADYTLSRANEILERRIKSYEE